MGGNYVGNERLRIGELAQLANVTKRTVDYYTNLGLLKPERSASNYRYYKYGELERLRKIVTYKKKQHSLDHIRMMLNQEGESKINPSEEQLNEKLNDLNEELQMVIRLLESEKKKKPLKNHVSHESVTLMQSLLLLLL
ncbi:MerR family transcriptional regulator [Peribacillus sp. JNUCC 23]|uniref:MerR family transcriptional regulator n=1 Tax=Peribacillus sp. NPDC096379 TaxID=3364393 RepID=UPI00382230B6